MASSNREQEERFYNEVRKRTAKRFHDSLTLNPKEQEKADKLLAKFKKKPESVYSFYNVLWLLLSIAVFYITDFAVTILYDRRVDRGWLYCGGFALLISTLCCFYCIVWLSWVKKISSDDWETYNHYVIPIATAAGVIGLILVMGAVWPVWRVLTIPIVGTQALGFVVFIAMIPDII